MMDKNSLKQKVGFYHENRFLIMLLMLFGFMLFHPLISSFINIRFLVRVSLTFIFLSGIFAVSKKKHQPIIASLLALPVFALMWASYFVDIGGFKHLHNLFAMLFMLHMVILFLGHIFSQDEITREVIFGALAIYLLWGLMWTYGYALLGHLLPGSFSYPDTLAKLDFASFNYFSFVTMTTLGYGDISPVSPPARAMAITQAVTGQVYLAVLVARLVGINIAQNMAKK
jgi:voltage-gated potassium channel